jgi:hypothetical protein
MTYQVKTYKQFGQMLLNNGDLDPVYLALNRSQLDYDTKLRWCLAYWCFYHVGTASIIATAKSPKKYFELMKMADKNLPRGTERRHFRGAASKKAIAHLSNQGHPEDIVLNMLGVTGERDSEITFEDVYLSITRTPQFGPWIAFKVADMAERCLEVSVSFEDCELDMYKDPKQGAALIDAGDVNAEVDIKRVVKRLIKEFSGNNVDASGRIRKPNLQEIETILCKYKSHYRGHYPIGKDTMEYRGILCSSKEWGKIGTQLFESLPTWHSEFQL